MKKGILFFVTAIAVGFFTACDDGDEATPNAVACFDYSPSEDISIGDEIAFANCSENATSFAWDYGDGDISTEENPTHSYKEGGEFTVKLVAGNESSADTISQKLIIKSSLVSSLIHFGTTYPLTKAFVYKFSYEDNSKRFMLNLGGDGMNINGDDLSGNGEGVTVYAIGEFSIGTFTILDDSWAISDWVSNPNGPGTGNESNLEGGTIKILSASNPIEIEINGTNTEVYYKGNATISGGY